jgi:prevent-host-death family protein
MQGVRGNICTVSEFRRNTSRLLRQLRKSGEPIILTLNGRAEVVVLEANSYQKLRESLNRLETLDGIREGVADMRAGRMLTPDDAREEARKKYGIRQ